MNNIKINISNAFFIVNDANKGDLTWLKDLVNGTQPEVSDAGDSDAKTPDMEVEDFTDIFDGPTIDDDIFTDDLNDDTDKSDSPSLLTGDSPIEDLCLSLRAYNCLKRSGIYTIAELVAMSDEDIMHVRNMGKKAFADIKEKLKLCVDPEYLAEFQPKVEKVDYHAELENMIGLSEAKEHIEKFLAFAKMQKDFAQQGKNRLPVSLHMAFNGNPGTGKTTVARLVAKILFDAGLLQSDEIVEAGRADLVAKYVGQTAPKVQEAFRKARGKVLFIDEAYSLLESQSGNFGDEAINAIVQEMENHRDETIVIFAGYTDRMEEFLERNPGLGSRVPFRINFQDYSADELLEIVQLEASGMGFAIDEEACRKVLDICRTAAVSKDAGNGRFARNLIENAVMAYALRLYGYNAPQADDAPANDSSNSAMDNLLIADDFHLPPTLVEYKKIRPIGFCA